MTAKLTHRWAVAALSLATAETALGPYWLLRRRRFRWALTLAHLATFPDR
jgi:hypothetical protein